ncbi:MAG: signal recognition particle-docking protein FtsY [Candidatus Bilamarchaeaceae archaeon]
MFDFLKKKFTDFIDKVTGKGSEGEKEEKLESETQKKEADVEPEKAEPEKKPEEKKQRRKTREKTEIKQPKVSLSITSTVKSLLTREVEIKEEDIRTTIENFELELIAGDVAIEVAEGIVSDLKRRLVGQKIKKEKLHEFIKSQMTAVLEEAMITGKEFDFLREIAQKERPVKILFLGINGSGKTTTIAKIAHLLIKNGYSVVMAGADTFRAAAIEQISIHADRLGVKLIKREYGSDPTSVAFDAVRYAEAHGIDVVLIDTAGRQETNINLMNELKKMERVIKPDMKLYVGESIGGSAVIEQVKAFNSEIGIDGIVLTKLDCDAKGGTTISVAKASGVPVVLIGTGQKYDDIESFTPEKIIERLMS